MKKVGTLSFIIGIALGFAVILMFTLVKGCGNGGDEAAQRPENPPVVYFKNCPHVEQALPRNANGRLESPMGEVPLGHEHMFDNCIEDAVTETVR